MCVVWLQAADGRAAMRACQSENVLLLRFIELSNLLLFTDKHPEKLDKAAKLQLKGFLTAAIERLETSKQRLRQYVYKIGEEQQRKAGETDTKAVAG